MITKEQAINKHNHYFTHVSFKNSMGKVRCRRNGKTKTWVRSPERFRIPVKYGIYEYFYIDETNAKDWELS